MYICCYFRLRLGSATFPGGGCVSEPEVHIVGGCFRDGMEEIKPIDLVIVRRRSGREVDLIHAAVNLMSFHHYCYGSLPVVVCDVT